MTNREKAQKIALDAVNRGFSGTESYCSAMEMAEWKEQQMIEKACKWLEDNAGAYQEDLREYGEGCEYDTSSLIEDFKKAILKSL